ncbi:hypothetical protein Tco_0917481 [Tanacetum coccineum]
MAECLLRGASILKGPLPSDNHVNDELLGLLDHHRTIIRRYPETFLCLVGLSRSFVYVYVCPTLLKDDDSDMGILDFVKSADPFKVKTRERTLAQGEIPLNNETVNMTVPPSAEIVQIIEHTIMDELKEHAGKKKKGLFLRTFLRNGLGLMRLWLLRLCLRLVEFVSSSVTPTPEPDVLEDSSSTQDGGVRTYHASMGIVVSFSSGPEDEVAAPRAENIVAASAEGVGASGNNVEASTSVPNADSPIDVFYDSQTIETATADNVYVPEWGVTNGSRVDNPAIYCNLLHHITPPGYGAMLRNQSATGFLDAFNFNFAQHTCMVSELRLRYEHKVMTREKFQKKFTNNCAVVRQRDAEIAALRARLKEVERKAAEVVALRGRVSELEAEVSAFDSKRVELNRHIIKLGVDYERLHHEVAGESKLRDEFKSFHDAAERSFAERASAFDARIADGLEAGVVHGGAGRSLSQIEAYDTDTEGKYVVTVSELENVSFALLDKLKILKDSPLALIMSALALKDDDGNTDATPEFRRFQPSLDQVSVPIYSGSGSIEREMLLLDAIPTIRESAKRSGLCPPSSTLGLVL